MGQPRKAEALWRHKLTSDRRVLGNDHPVTIRSIEVIGQLLTDEGDYGGAVPLLRECLALREKTQPDIWQTFNTHSLLGGALLGQKKYADAEPLLLKGYKGLRQREKTIPPQGLVRLPEALDRLVEQYTATDKPDDVKKWRAERARYPKVAPLPREKK